MSISLITGHQKTNHIRSVDARAQNRGVWGQGKYRTMDRTNAEVSVYPGNVSVAGGGIVWSGMYMRAFPPIEIPYAVPASSKKFGLYLHYTRDGEGVENVDFEVFSEDNAPTVTDILSDDTADAYTLYYSFTDTSGVISGGTYFCDLIPSIDSEHQQSQSQFNKLKERVVLANTISAGSTVTLKESIANFRELEIWSGRTFIRFPTSELATFLDNNYHVFSLHGGAYIASASGGAGIVTRNILTKISGTSFKYYEGSQINLWVENGALRSSSSDNPKLSKVVGVGRI